MYVCIQVAKLPAGVRDARHMKRFRQTGSQRRHTDRRADQQMSETRDVWPACRKSSSGGPSWNSSLGSISLMRLQPSHRHHTAARTETHTRKETYTSTQLKTRHNWCRNAANLNTTVDSGPAHIHKLALATASREHGHLVLGFAATSCAQHVRAQLVQLDRPGLLQLTT